MDLRNTDPNAQPDLLTIGGQRFMRVTALASVLKVGMRDVDDLLDRCKVPAKQIGIGGAEYVSVNALQCGMRWWLRNGYFDDSDGHEPSDSEHPIHFLVGFENMTNATVSRTLLLRRMKEAATKIVRESQKRRAMKQHHGEAYTAPGEAEGKR